MSNGKGDVTYYTLKEVGKHDKPDDVWIVINHEVYNVTSWLYKHPGGHLPILGLAGKDVTDAFEAFHTKQSHKYLKAFKVGEIVPEERHVPPELEDFRKMKRDLEAEGLFETNYWWYIPYIMWYSFLFLTAIGLAFLTDNFWLHMLSAVFLGFFWQQSAFWGHDLCHNAFTHNRMVDTFIACAASGFLGLSPNWWKRTHNVHHVVTNSVEFDPDIQHLPVFAVAKDYFNSVFSEYHGRTLHFDAISRWLVQRQHWLYYPIMCVARINLMIQGYINHIKSAPKEKFMAPLDIVSHIGVYWLWYGFMLYTFSGWKERILYHLLAQGVSGLLHVQITISHFAMPVYDKATRKGRPYNFVRTQLDHSMDVECSPWMDWFHGGLQFQVVHHLFPRLPRHNLRHVKEKYLIPYCKKHDLKLHGYDFITCNKMVLNTLFEASKEAAKHPGTKLDSSVLFSATH